MLDTSTRRKIRSMMGCVRFEIRIPNIILAHILCNCNGLGCSARLRLVGTVTVNTGYRTEFFYLTSWVSAFFIGSDCFWILSVLHAYIARQIISIPVSVALLAVPTASEKLQRRTKLRWCWGQAYSFADAYRIQDILRKGKAFCVVTASKL